MQSDTGGGSAQAEDVDVEMTSPPSDSQLDDDVRHLVDEYLAEHGDEILPLKPEDVRSMLPSETMTAFALNELIDSMIRQAWGQGSRQDWGQGSRQDWDQDRANPAQQPQKRITGQARGLEPEVLIGILEPNADGSQRFDWLLGERRGKARTLALFLAGPSNCEVALIGTADHNRRMRNRLADSKLRIAPHEQRSWSFTFYNIQVSGEETGSWTCRRESEVGLLLAGAFLDCLLHGFESLSDRMMLGEAYDTRKISYDCLRHSLPGLQLTLEAEEGEVEGEGGQRSDGDSGHPDDHDEEEDDDSDDEEDDSDEEEEDQNEGASDGDEGNITKEEQEQIEKFDFDKIIHNMSMVDMEDNDDVEKRVKGAIEPHERKNMELSREIEEKIISALPTNEKVGEYLSALQPRLDLFVWANLSL